MALTYRQTKGSALTIQELDDNFQHFTGSHSVTGSLVVSGSFEVTGSTSITGSSSFFGDQTITGSITVSGSNITHVFPVISASLEFIDDAAAAAGGVPLGGLYRSGNFILIRLT
jgi:hypothetical protein